MVDSPIIIIFIIREPAACVAVCAATTASSFAAAPNFCCCSYLLLLLPIGDMQPHCYSSGRAHPTSGIIAQRGRHAGHSGRRRTFGAGQGKRKGIWPRGTTTAWLFSEDSLCLFPLIRESRRKHRRRCVALHPRFEGISQRQPAAPGTMNVSGATKRCRRRRALGRRCSCAGRLIGAALYNFTPFLAPLSQSPPLFQGSLPLWRRRRKGIRDRGRVSIHHHRLATRLAGRIPHRLRPEGNGGD